MRLLFSRLGQCLISTTTPEAVARTVAKVADDLFGWDGFVFYPCFEDAGESYPGVFIDTVNGERVDVPPPNSNNQPSVADRRVLANGAELILKESLSDREPGSIPYGDRSRPSGSIMRVPVRVRRKVTAIFSAHSYTLQAYSRNDLNTFQTLADYCGAALDRIWADRTFRNPKHNSGWCGKAPRMACDWRMGKVSLSRSMRPIAGWSKRRKRNWKGKLFP